MPLWNRSPDKIIVASIKYVTCTKGLFFPGQCCFYDPWKIINFYFIHFFSHLSFNLGSTNNIAFARGTYNVHTDVYTRSWPIKLSNPETICGKSNRKEQKLASENNNKTSGWAQHTEGKNVKWPTRAVA